MNEQKTIWNINKLHSWDKNPRGILTKDYERLKKQITKLGQYKPLLITPDGTVLGGNMRLKAFKDLGITDIWVSIISPKTEAERFEYALSDNDRIGYYEDDKLAEFIQQYKGEISLELYKVDLGKSLSLTDVLNQFGPDVIEDEPPAVEDVAVSKLGEVYQLGRHRLVCGSATESGDIFKLMDNKDISLLFTDPPYGVKVVGDNGKIGAGNLAKNQTYSPVIGDDTTDTSEVAYKIISGQFKCKNYIIWGGNYFTAFLPPSPCWIIWDKRDGMPSNNFADCEIAWTNFTTPARIYKQLWNGMIREGNEGKKLHPTQKPVKLHADILKDFTKEDDIVLDLFGGSGSTLIACEQTNRTCYMMEIDPLYCDVIKKRYENFTNK